VNELEKNIQRKILQKARRNKAIVFKSDTPPRGWPDLTYIKDGQVAFIEVKRPGQAPRLNQQRRLAELSKQGIPCIAADSVEAALEFINSL